MSAVTGIPQLPDSLISHDSPIPNYHGNLQQTPTAKKTDSLGVVSNPGGSLISPLVTPGPANPKCHDDAQQILIATENTARPTDVPELLSSLKARCTMVPKFERVHDNALEAMMPGSAPFELQLPIKLMNYVQAAILETELVRALERVAAVEYFWVYFEGPEKVSKILDGKPLDVRSEDALVIALYLRKVQNNIISVVEAHMDPDIFQISNPWTTRDLRGFFDEHRPSDENWRAYIHIAEHCRTNVGPTFRTIVFSTTFTIAFFMQLLAERYDSRLIIKIFERGLRDGMLRIPNSSWHPVHVDRLLTTVRRLIYSYQKEKGLLTGRTDQHKNTPRASPTADGACNKRNDKRGYRGESPRPKKPKSGYAPRRQKR